MAQQVKNSARNAGDSEMQARSLSQEDPLRRVATHPVLLPGRNPWTAWHAVHGVTQSRDMIEASEHSTAYLKLMNYTSMIFQ